MKAREPRPSLNGALTVEQFCNMFCITEEVYAALRRNHLGPREIRIRDRKLIALLDAAQWRCEIEPLRQLAQRYLCR